MSTLLSLPCALLAFLLPLASPAQEATDLDQQALEDEFARTMTGCELVGHFTMDGDPADQPPKEDRYSIHKVSKIREDLWKFEARIEYGGQEAIVPLALHVKWAGDTPVITLTDFPVPGLGTYTARVLIYRGHYAGTWSGKDYGGKMYGKVVRAGEQPAGQEETGGGTPPSAGDKDDTGDKNARRAVKAKAADHWSSFRGPGARGVDDSHPLTAEWSASEDRNIKWKTGIPGLAHSSPVIWGDMIFVTSAEQDGKDADLRVGLYGDIAPVEDEGEHAFTLYCLDKYDGQILWNEVAHAGVPAIKRHPKGSHAACSPVTDGKHVVAFFASEGLYCYDVEGTLLWSKNLGVLDAGFYMVPDAQWGSSSSPVIHEDLLILQCDVQKGSFLLALDIETGAEVWRTPRDEVPTWGTPTVHVAGDRAQVICNGYKHIGGYDLRTGKELWKLVGGGDIPVPTPIVAHDLIYITNAHGQMAPIYAIRTDASGELVMDPEKCKAMAWSNPRLGNYMQTPVAYGDHLYLCSDAGVVTCLEAKTGKEVYRKRLGKGRDGFTASAVAGDGKLYFTSEEGVIHVAQAGPEFKLLAENEMGETCMATPAISEGVLYFRTRHHLVAVQDLSHLTEE